MKSNQKNKYNISKIVQTEAKKYHFLSCSQIRFWVLYKMKPDSLFCNCYYVEKITGNLDIFALKKAIQFMVSRHETLRTNFREINGNPVQVIHKKSEIKLEIINLNRKKNKRTRENEINKEIEETILCPFKLESDPLLRVKLVRIKEREYIFVLAAHHIIFDFWSLCVFDRELVELYNAFSQNQKPNLPDLPFQYKDYVEWERKKENSKDVKSQEKYWIEKLSGRLPVLNLPSDKIRPDVQTFSGETGTIELNKELLKRITKFIQKNNTTLFNFVFSVFGVFLHKLTNQTDIIIGMPTTNRDYQGTENIIGVFVNNLPVRIKISSNQKFVSVLNHLRQKVIEAIDNKEYPLEQLIEKLNINRSLSQASLFNVICQADNRPDWVDSKWNKLYLKYQYQRINLGATHVDLRFFVIKKNNGITLNLNYNADLFYQATIKQWMKYLKTLLINILENPQAKLEDLEMITLEQKKHLINNWSRIRKDCFERKTVHQLFEKKVEKNPNSIAAVFGSNKITYRKLNQRANQLARFLIEAKIGKGNIVPIFLENSTEILVSMLAILKTGGAFVLLDVDTPKMRIAKIIKDTSTKIVISHTDHTDKLKIKNKIIFIDKEEIQGRINRKSKINLNLKINPENLSSVVYTSSTTGDPKGVMVKHCNILKDVYHLVDGFNLKSNCCLCQSSSITYSVSLAQFFAPLLIGAKLFIYPKETTTDPFKLFEKIKRDKIKLLKMTPSLVNIFLDSAIKSELNWLNNLTLVLTGEKVSESLVKKINKLNRGIKLFSEYGQSECMTITKFYKIDFSKIKKILIGKPENGCGVYILDEKLNPTPIGLIGGIYVSGADSIFGGYLNDQEKTKKVIFPNPFINGDVIYRTGDLGKMHPDGNIEYLGRADNQIKIRGNRIELEEVEAQLLKYPQIKQVAVAAKKEKKTNEIYLAAYYISDNKKLKSQELRSYLKNILPDYMIPSYFIRLDRFPLNANGKLDRLALPEPNKDSLIKIKQYQPPQTESEKKLVKIWQEVLGIKKIGINDNFFELGGHSLKAVQVISRIKQQLSKQIELKQFFQFPTVKELANTLNKAKTTSQSITPVKPKSFYALSYAQIRHWVLYKMEPESYSYNIFIVFRLLGKLDVSLLKRSIESVVKRHESLRTNIREKEGIPVQVVDNNSEIKLGVVNLDYKTNRDKIEQENSIIQAVIRKPFKLESDRLFRFELIKTKTNQYSLILVINHIIFDAWSGGILTTELSELYNSYLENREPQLATPPIQFKDYVEWEQSDENKRKLKRQEKYWLNKLSGELPILNLPTDKRRPVMQTYNGDLRQAFLDKDIFERLNQLVSQTNTTQFITLFAVFNILLNKLSNQNDLVIGTLAADRDLPEIENIIGLLFNNLAIRTKLQPEQSFLDLLGQVKQNVLDGFANKDYSFDQLVEKLNPSRDLSRSPIFNVVFQHEKAKDKSLNLLGIKTDYKIFSNNTTKFDIKLRIVEENDFMTFFCEYNTDLFYPETIQGWLGYYINILKQILEHPKTKIKDVDLLNEEERKKLIYGKYE